MDAISLPNPGLTLDMFIARFDSAGHALWGRRAGSNGADLLQSVDASIPGKVYMAGATSGDTLQADSLYYVPSGYSVYHPVIIGYDTAGNVQQIIHADTGTALPRCMAIDTSGTIYIGGFFFQSCRFDTSLITDDHTPSATEGDIFIAQYRTRPQSAHTSVPVVILGTLSLYPNPNNGSMTVTFHNSGYRSIIIYDCTGRKIYSSTLSGTEQYIDLNLPTHPDGVYYLQAMKSNGTADNIPFVIQR